MIREIKCPYGDNFEGGDECDRCEQYELCMESYPPVNLIEIPKGATNGDVVIRAFPNLKYNIQNGRVVTTIGVASSFDLDWWNAPYN